MRFVPVKSVDQQGVLCLHRVRQGFIEERTATINRIRGLLSEFGVVLPLCLTAAIYFAAHLGTSVRLLRRSSHKQLSRLCYILCNMTDHFDFRN